MQYSINSDSIIVETPKAIYHKPCGILLFMYFGSVEDAKIIARADKLMSVDGGKVDHRELCTCKHCHRTLNTKELDIVELENPVMTGLRERLREKILKEQEDLQKWYSYAYNFNRIYHL